MRVLSLSYSIIKVQDIQEAEQQQEKQQTVINVLYLLENHQQKNHFNTHLSQSLVNQMIMFSEV